jgi:hypothetical protein
MRRLLLPLLAALVVAPAAGAATKQPVFGLRAVGNNARGYFVYTLARGSSQTGAVIVSNVGTATGTVRLFTADATTGRTTGTVYETDKRPRRTGSWITLSTRSLTLAPGAHKQVPFTLHVPSDAPAGQWVGGIVAETSHKLKAAKSKQKTNVQIKIRDLTIVAVQANVPGLAVVKLAIGKVTTGGQHGFQQLFVHFAHQGNVLVKPTGTVTVLDASGKAVETIPFTMDTFLPQTAIDYPVLLKKALGPGDYRARVTLRSPAGAAPASSVTATPAFTVSKANVKQVFTSASPTQSPHVGSTASGGSSTPWALIAAAVVIALLALLGLGWWLRRRGRSGPPAPPPVPPVVEPPAAPEPRAPRPAAEEVVARSSAVALPPECTNGHYWDVAYDQGQLGSDGVWRFPHRCRHCGRELLARDIGDANALSAHLPTP